MTTFALEHLQDMTSRAHIHGRRHLRRILPVVLAGAMLALAGCSSLQALKKRVGHALGVHKPEVTTTPASEIKPSKPPTADARKEPVPSLREIVNRQLQQGHYRVGRKQLQRYLAEHPDDRAARDLWRQLTVDPNKLLGKRSRVHVVQSGESYSTLAARYLGSASRFLALARYNHAENPSVLNLGQRIRIPAVSADQLKARMAATSTEHAPAAARTDAADVTDAAATPAPAPLPRAQQLQQQSLALLDRGTSSRRWSAWARRLTPTRS